MSKEKSSKSQKYNAEQKDESPYVFQRKKIEREINIRQRSDLTETQKQIIAAAQDKDVKCIILDGVPGSGKSYTSILSGMTLLGDKKVGQMIYVRSLVQAKDGEIGFLPGTVQEKTFYYDLPFYQALEEMISKSDIDYLIKDERIITYPTSMLRSYNFHNSVVIAEEAQNYQFDSLYTVSTRLGMFSKLFIIGDSLNQNDLGKKSGFSRFCSIFSDEESHNNGFRFFRLTSADIVRSPFVKFVVEKVEKYNEKS